MLHMHSVCMHASEILGIVPGDKAEKIGECVGMRLNILNLNLMGSIHV